MENDFSDDVKLDAIIDRLKQFIGAKPENPTAHYNLGLAFLRKGLLEDAAFAFQVALELDPKNQKLRDRYRKAGFGDPDAVVKPDQPAKKDKKEKKKEKP